MLPLKVSVVLFAWPRGLPRPGGIRAGGQSPGYLRCDGEAAFNTPSCQMASRSRWKLGEGLEK